MIKKKKKREKEKERETEKEKKRKEITSAATLAFDLTAPIKYTIPIRCIVTVFTIALMAIKMNS